MFLLECFLGKIMSKEINLKSAREELHLSKEYVARRIDCKVSEVDHIADDERLEMLSTIYGYGKEDLKRGYTKSDIERFKDGIKRGRKRNKS